MRIPSRAARAPGLVGPAGVAHTAAVEGDGPQVAGAVLVVCTRDRPDEVRACLESVRWQTVVPVHVLVVDASADERTRRVVDELARSWPGGSRLEHLAAAPGLTRQRNAGIDRSDGDPVLFVDDDAVLEPGYVAGVLDAFAARSDRGRPVVGVGGFITNQPEHHHRAVDRWLLLDGEREGAVLPSGRNVRVHRLPAHLLDVDWLPGCAMAYRRAVLERERPDPALGSDRNGEDVELSARIAQHGRLVVAPAARLAHLESPIGRRTAVELVPIELLSRFERVVAGHGPTSRRAFWRSAWGQLAWYALKAAVTGSRERARIARATWQGIRAARASDARLRAPATVRRGARGRAAG